MLIQLKGKTIGLCIYLETARVVFIFSLSCSAVFGIAVGFFSLLKNQSSADRQVSTHPVRRSCNKTRPLMRALCYGCLPGRAHSTSFGDASRWRILRSYCYLMSENSTTCATCGGGDMPTPWLFSHDLVTAQIISSSIKNKHNNFPCCKQTSFNNYH